ncbi:MAG: response regulator [Actinomycetota bacterium]|jgi:response regulator NasT|nr:response regulator [Actinomycetota bacterium]
MTTAPEFASLRVVVAEDEAVIRMDLVEMVRELGHQVVGEAFNGQQAVDLVRSAKPDLVFLDIAMPERDGLSAAEEIAGEDLCAVVMVTAFSQRDISTKAAQAGAVGYVVKPFTMADLDPAISLAMARWQQIQDLKAQVSTLGERAASREAVERAKELLQRGHQMSEPEAFAWLRRAAMDRRVTLAEAATALLAGQVTP